VELHDVSYEKLQKPRFRCHGLAPWSFTFGAT